MHKSTIVIMEVMQSFALHPERERQQLQNTAGQVQIAVIEKQSVLGNHSVSTDGQIILSYVKAKNRQRRS